MSHYILILQEKPAPRHSKTTSARPCPLMCPSKELKKVQSGLIQADKKNDPHPAK